LTGPPEVPTAWRGRERVVQLILRARTLTRRSDIHYAPLGALVVSCFGEKTFPDARTMEETLSEVSAAVARQNACPAQDFEAGRLLEVIDLLSEAMAERTAVP
jgi:hypothetical protein